MRKESNEIRKGSHARGKSGSHWSLVKRGSNYRDPSGIQWDLRICFALLVELVVGNEILHGPESMTARKYIHFD